MVVTAVMVVVVGVVMVMGLVVAVTVVMVVSVSLICAMVVLVLTLMTAARALHAAGPVSAAHRPFLITRTQALRNAWPRRVALVHSRVLPKMTQSLDSL